MIKWLLLAAIICSLIGWNLWGCSFAWHDFFYHFAILERVCIYTVILILTKHIKILYCIALVGMANAMCDMVDELFFDPTKQSWNDWVFLLIAISLSIRIYVRK